MSCDFLLDTVPATCAFVNQTDDHVCTGRFTMNPHLVACPSAPVPAPTNPPPLLERLRLPARARGDSQPTADTLVSWARAYILFHNKRHPSELGLLAATHFLQHVVKTAPEPLPALAQARSALMLLYGDVLGMDLGELPQPRPPRLLDQLRQVLRVRHLCAGDRRVLCAMDHAVHPVPWQTAST
jgi:hypothetical protein